MVLVTRERVWDVLSDPGACAEAAAAGQTVLNSLDEVGAMVSAVVSDTEEIAPEAAGLAYRAMTDVVEAHALIEPTVGRLRELGR